MMPLYTKKPVTVEARQWDGGRSSAAGIVEWVESLDQRAVYWTEGGESGIDIYTPEGRVTADPRDFVICGVEGEAYPCKPGVFAATYELAGGGPDA